MSQIRPSVWRRLTDPWKAAQGIMARAGKDMLLVAVPASGSPSARLATAPPLAVLAPPKPDSGLISVQTLGSREEGKARRHCCGFAAKEGTYLGYLGDAQGTGSTPHSSGCQHSATGTCHLRNVFIFFQALAGQVPATLIECRKGRGWEREGWGHRLEQRTRKRTPKSYLRKKTPGLAKSILCTVCQLDMAPQILLHPTGSHIPPWTMVQ